MSNLLFRARRAVMGVPEREVQAFKGGETPNWQHLEKGVRAAIGGYHAVVDGGDLSAVLGRISDVPVSLSGYAHEGVAMGLTGLDCVLPGRSRFREFLAGPGDAHAYMVHIGAGEALARLRRHPEQFLARLDDPALRWLVMDGYGFHAKRKYVDRQVVPSFLSPYARRVLRPGRGSQYLVFYRCRHRPHRRLHSGSTRGPLARRVATAAEIRYSAGHPAHYTELACLGAWDGANGAAVARIASAERAADFPVGDGTPRYEAWRERIRRVWQERHLKVVHPQGVSDDYIR